MSDPMANIPASIPLGSPPPGQTSNFHAVDLQPLLIGTHAAFLSLMVIILALRLYVRGVVIKSLWWEDFLATLAGATIIANSGVIFSLLDVGFGRHLWNVRIKDVLTGNALKRFSVVGLPYPLAILFIKLSVAVLYWRIFNISSKIFRLATIFIMCVCTVFYLGFFVYSAVQSTICSDISRSLSDPNCGSGTIYITWISGIVGVVTDLYLFVLPIFPLAKLKMSRQKKLGIWIVFSAGGLATAASVARLVTAVILESGTDYLYTAAANNVPTTIEMCLGVVAASIPTLGKMHESVYFNKIVAAVRSYASTLSLIRRPSTDHSGSVQLSVHHFDTPSSSTDKRTSREHSILTDC